MRARVALLVAGTCLVLRKGALVVLPHLGAHELPGRGTSPASALALLVISAAGPALTFAVLWVSYRRFHDVPAAKEEELQRPFRAWLPVGILDAIYVVIVVGDQVMSET